MLLNMLILILRLLAKGQNLLNEVDFIGGLDGILAVPTNLHSNMNVIFGFSTKKNLQNTKFSV